MEENKKYNFINPYNFIPLDEHCKREFDDNDEIYTGYMKCELETLTPLIMLDTDKIDYVLTSKQEEGVKKHELDAAKIKEEDMHKVYNETFKIDGKPAIPGSELRGMIRSKFEALTSSCMSSVEEELEFASRYKGSMNKAGILDLTDPENVKLYKCDKYVVDNRGVINQLRNRKSGEFIKFRPADRYIRNRVFNNGVGKIDVIEDKGTQSGYLRKGEFCAGREATHIFVKTSNEVDVENKKDLYKMFLLSRDKTNNNLGHPHKALAAGANTLDKYSKKSNREIIQPVWYEIVNNKVYLSVGQNGQVRYDRVLKDLIPEEFRPCDGTKGICEACRVFGFVSEENAVNGKVRVSDAVMISNHDDCYCNKRTLQELASPKYENVRFYMEINQNGQIARDQMRGDWTTDFKSIFNKDTRTNEAHIFKNKENVMIRGRKEYWHHDPEKMNGYNMAEKTKRNITVRPVKGKYIFYVYFNNLTKEQLEHLNMAVSLGNDSDYAHKVGHGKPLGYGSVKVNVTDIQCRELTENSGIYTYRLKEYVPEYQELFDAFKFENNEIKKCMEHMYDNKFIKSDVIIDYPRTTQDGPIFKWFGSNRKKVLPFSNEEYESLILVGEEKDYGNKNNRNNNNRNNNKEYKKKGNGGKKY